MPEVKVEKSHESKMASSERQRAGAITRPGEFLTSHDLFALNPFSMMRRMSEAMERALSTSFGTVSSGSRLGFPEAAAWAPDMEVFEKDNQLVIKADLPGIKKDEVKVQLTDDGLVIEGERRREHEEQHAGYYRTERSYGHFYRTIPLPDGTDSEKIQAQFKDGVLEVTCPLPESYRARRREIPIRP
jgi:HSP20 family protein